MPSIHGDKHKFQNLLRPLHSGFACAIVFAIPGLLPGSNLQTFRVIAPAQWIVMVLLLATIVNRSRHALVELRGRAL